MINQMQWFVGTVLILIGGIGSVFFHVYTKIDSVEEAASEGDKALWKAFEDERESMVMHRERIIEKVASLPNKQDLERMEVRIMSAIKEGKS